MKQKITMEADPISKPSNENGVAYNWKDNPDTMAQLESLKILQSQPPLSVETIESLRPHRPVEQIAMMYAARNERLAEIEKDSKLSILELYSSKRKIYETYYQTDAIRDYVYIHPEFTPDEAYALLKEQMAQAEKKFV